MNESATKPCARCGRTITWRKRWAKDWDAVRYCSERCRRGRLSDVDRALEAAILELLAERGLGKTICPSEAARRVRPEEWRPLLEPARQAARRLQANGQVEITQGGHRVDPSLARGPIRLRTPRRAS